MISKPLFKQSVKANWGIWTAITAATCFMLALIISMTGGSSINNILGAIEESFTKNTVRCEIQGAAMNYYYMGDTAKNYYDGGLEIPEVVNIFNIGAQVTGASEEEMQTAASFVTALLTQYSAIKPVPDADAFITVFVSGLLGQTMPAQLLQNGLTEQQLTDYGFTQEGIKEISAEAILTFRGHFAALSASIAGSPSPEEINGLIKKLTTSLMSELPDDTRNNMTSMKNLDLTRLMTGEIFFRIAGLLLPVIYIIMVSISLISGQVDSGSMAYILSTPTKRRAVTLTQAAFLISSLLLMCLLTTVTSLVCLAIVGDSSISYTQMLILNAGYLITMFAFAGICFLSSSWFNRSKRAMAVGGGISMYFVVATIMGLFASKAMPPLLRIDAMNFFNYTTITSFFDSASMLDGTLMFLWKLAVLFGIGLSGFIIGMLRFNKKDLPL